MLVRQSYLFGSMCEPAVGAVVTFISVLQGSPVYGSFASCLWLVIGVSWACLRGVTVLGCQAWWADLGGHTCMLDCT